MEDEARDALSIAELAGRAEVTPRTVRYYVSEGLLPPPGGAGQQRVYTHEHLLRLKTIKRLKDRYLPLGEIRERLAGLTLAEMEELAQAPPEPAPSSAFDYISAVLANSAPRDMSAPPAPPAFAPLAAPGATPPAAPPAFMPPTVPLAVPVTPPLEPPMAPPTGAFTPDRSAPAAELPEPPPSRGHPASAPPAQRTSTPPAQGAPAGVWQRVALAPGVELHYQPSGDKARDSAIARLIGAAARLFAHPSPPQAPDDNQSNR